MEFGMYSALILLCIDRKVELINGRMTRFMHLCLSCIITILSVSFFTITKLSGNQFRVLFISPVYFFCPLSPVPH